MPIKDIYTIRSGPSVVLTLPSHDDAVENVGDREANPGQRDGLRVAVVAYGVSPVRGTEPGNSWRFAVGLAQRGIKVELITTELFCDEWAQANTPTALRIRPITGVLPSEISGKPGVYWSYLRFLDRATDLIRSLSKEAPLDVVHHYSWGSLTWGTPVWRSGIPAVFGPVGGGSVSHSNLYPFLSPSSKILETLRTVVVRSTRLNRRVVNSIRRSILVAANSDTRNVITRLGARLPVEVIPESATPEVF